MATLIPALAEPQEVLPHSGEAFTLQELQLFVGGYIEMLRLGDGRVMFLNEDGKRENLPVNYRATAMMASRLRGDDYIVGTVIICTLAEAGGDGAGEE